MNKLALSFFFGDELNCSAEVPGRWVSSLECRLYRVTRSLWPIVVAAEDEEEEAGACDLPVPPSDPGSLFTEGGSGDGVWRVTEAGGSGRNPSFKIFSVVAGTLPPFFSSSQRMAATLICGNITLTESMSVWETVALGRRPLVGPEPPEA